MKEKLKKILKIVKLRTIIVLIVLLVFNSYAWFVYANKVAGSITAHITSWNVQFKAGEDDATTNVTFEVDRIFPGMDPYEETITAYNSGETGAILSVQVLEVRILDTVLTQTSSITSDDLIEIIADDYPFKILIEVDNINLVPVTGQANIKISLTWEFESGDDETDTYWGEEAYAYYALNPGVTSINILLELEAIQN